MSTETVEAPKLPEKIDRYEIIEELGRGGMATVFRARDPRFDREVAIKILPRVFLHDHQFRARFEREAKTIATLEHTAIVPVHDFGEDDGQPYIVMRLMSGGTLADRLQKGKIPLKDAVRIITRLSHALEAAHSKGIIHRDLKPGNILFDQYDNAYLSDFGIARIIEASTNITKDGSAIGTPAYMSPEQVQGSKAVDGRSDIYALGVIFYQMLVGTPPYQSDTPAKVLMMHILEPIPSLLDSLPDLPPGLENWLHKALAKDPEDRFSNVSEMSTALTKTVTTGEAVDIKLPPVKKEKKKKGIPSGIRLVIFGAIALGIGYGALYLASTFNLIPGFAAATPSATQFATEETAPSETPIAIAQASVQTLETATATLTSSSTVSPSQTPELIPSMTITPSGPLLGGADIFAFVSGNNIWITNLDGTESRQLTNSGGTKLNLQWSPDGQTVFYVQNKCVLSVDILTGQEKSIFCPNWVEYVGGFQLSPDGTQVAISLSDGLYVLPFDLATISSIRTKQQLENAEICVSYIDSATKAVRWSKDGSELAAVTVVTLQGRPAEMIKIFRISRCGQPLVRVDEFPGQRFTMNRYNISPTITDFDWNGEESFALAVNTLNGYGELYIYNSITKKAEIMQPIQGRCCYLGFRWSPDGEYFLFAFQDQRYGEGAQLYNVIYGTIGSGAVYEPLALPSNVLTDRRENPQPAFRPSR